MGKNRTPAVEDRMNAGADTLMRWAAPKIENMLAWAEKGAGESKARAKIAASQATHQMEDTVDKVTPRSSQASPPQAPLSPVRRTAS